MSLSLQSPQIATTSADMAEWKVARDSRALIPCHPVAVPTVRVSEVAASGAALVFEKVLRALSFLHDDGSAQAWELALRELNAAFPGSQGLWIEHASGVPKPRKAFTSEKFATAYLGGFHLLDPLAQNDCVCHMATLMEPMRIDEVVEPRMFERGAFAWNFLVGQGVLGQGLGICFPVGPERLARLWLFRPRELPFQEYEARALAQFAVQASRILGNRAECELAVSSRAETAAVLDELSAPCFVVDQDAKLLFANTAAKRLTRRGGPLSLQEDTLVAAVQADEGSSGHDAIAALLEKYQGESGRNGSQGGFAAMTLPDASGETGRWFAFATRLRASGRNAKPRYAITVTDALHPGAILGEQQMRQLFGFTPTESRVAQALLTGQTTDAIAAAMTVRRDTVRCHIKSLLAKTGSRSHTELQKLLLRIAPAFDPG